MGYVQEIRKLVGQTPIILNSAGVILTDRDNRILLVNRKDTNNWGLPGGYMELGETFEETIIRELKEELAITLTGFHYFKTFSGKEFYHQYPNGDEVYSVITIYTSHIYNGNITPDNNEVRDAKFFPIESIPDSLTKNTETILQYFQTETDYFTSEISE